MRIAGIIVVVLLAAYIVVGIAPKTKAASSGVVIATVQIRQPAKGTIQTQKTLTPKGLMFAGLIAYPQLISSIGPLPALPFKIKLTIKTKNGVFEYA